MDLCHFIQLWKITPFLYNNIFRFGGGKLPPPPAGAPENNQIIKISDKIQLKSTNTISELTEVNICMKTAILLRISNNIIQGRCQGGRGKSPPPETEKIVVEKWCYFRKLYC